MINYLKEPNLTCPAIRFSEMATMKKALGHLYNSDEDGVPSYLLIDKRGKVTFRGIEEPSPTELKELIKAAEEKADSKEAKR